MLVCSLGRLQLRPPQAAMQWLMQGLVLGLHEAGMADILQVGVGCVCRKVWAVEWSLLLAFLFVVHVLGCGFRASFTCAQLSACVLCSFVCLLSSACCSDSQVLTGCKRLGWRVSKPWWRHFYDGSRSALQEGSAGVCAECGSVAVVAAYACVSSALHIGQASASLVR